MQIVRQLFSFYNPLFYVILLGFIVLLRWPAFSEHYVSGQEAYYALAAQRMAAGHTLYADTFIAGPPLVAVAYKGLIQLLGVQGGLLCLKILACMLVFGLGLLLNSFYNAYRFSQTPSTLPSVLFVFVVCMPWYGLEAGTELVLLLPLLIGVRTVLDLSFEKEQHWLRIYFIGILGGLVLLTAWEGWVVALLLLFAYFLMCRPSLRNVFTLAGGFLSVALVVAVALKWQGNLQGFLQWAYRMPTFGTAVAEEAASLWTETSVLCGAVVLVGLVGIATFRGRFYSQPIRLRRAGDMMLYILLAGAGIWLLHYREWQFRHLWLLLLPFSFYAAYWVENGLPRRYQWLPVALLLVAPIVNGMAYVATQRPTPYEAYLHWVYPPQKLQAHVARLHESEMAAQLRPLLTQTGAPGQAWFICPGQANVAKLQLQLQSPYIEYQALAQHFPALLSGAGTIPAAELRRIYLQWQADPPAYVVDCAGAMPRLQAQAPLLLQHYGAHPFGGGVAYLQRPQHAAAALVKP
jgi:hypothetical protein